jgi:hypothetical protein
MHETVGDCVGPAWALIPEAQVAQRVADTDAGVNRDRRGNIVEVLVDHLPGDGAINLHLERDVFAGRGSADQVIDVQHLQSDGAVTRLKPGLHCGATGRVQVLRPAEAREVCRVNLRPVTGHPAVPAAIEWE